MPLSRLSVCLNCGSELYVCLMCRFHDPKLSDGCREERAEHVQEKARANFCEYFEPRPGAFQARDEAPTSKARAELDALFGGPRSESVPDAAPSELDKLFGNKTKN
ncbi:MAG TPA: hypothetical protein VGH71_03445 [Gammaproteobacteria bacterium]|jgi:hypothetical protein